MVRRAETIRRLVKSGYAEIARRGGATSCGGEGKPCCGSVRAEQVGCRIGYGRRDFDAAPEGANLGLGCGNPTALALLRKGETVLDLGSGAGFDCFLSARRVGPTGKVIGVDMTPAMVRKARRNAKKSGRRNVEFRLGDIEKLPVDDDSVDVVISNCVINLAPDKRRAFREAFRVLKSGGRMFVSDLVLTGKLPRAILEADSALVGCIAGAAMQDRYLAAVKAAGFKRVRVLGRTRFPTDFITDCAVGKKITERQAKSLSRSVISVNVTGFKPARKGGRGS